LVEQLICNHQVAGSIPAAGTIDRCSPYQGVALDGGVGFKLAARLPILRLSPAPPGDPVAGRPSCIDLAVEDPWGSRQSMTS
jgi:hypothetical protein